VPGVLLRSIVAPSRLDARPARSGDRGSQVGAALVTAGGGRGDRDPGVRSGRRRRVAFVPEHLPT